MTRRYSKYTDEEIAEVIVESKSLMEASEILNINRKTAARVARDLNVKPLGIRRTNPDVILGCDRKYRSPNIRKYILRHNLIEYRCLFCGNDGTWQGQELVLELDHINGNPLDNSLDNLRWLCPNCHTQTPTYRGKKRDNG